MMPSSPCYGCEKRNISCHSTCEEYIAYQQKMIEFNRERRKEAMVDSFFANPGRLTRYHNVPRRKGGNENA